MPTSYMGTTYVIGLHVPGKTWSMRFAWQWHWRLLPSGMWRSVSQVDA